MRARRHIVLGTKQAADNRCEPEQREVVSVDQLSNECLDAIPMSREETAYREMEICAKVERVASRKSR